MDSSGVLLQTSNNSINEKNTSVTQTQIEIRIAKVGEAILPPAAAPLSEGNGGGGGRREDEEHNHHQPDGRPLPIPITISPATPDSEHVHEDEMTSPERVLTSFEDGEPNGFTTGANKPSALRVKKSLSFDRGGGNKKVQQVQQMLKERVHKGRAGISAVSKKIGHGVAVGGGIKQHHSHRHGSGGRRGRGLMMVRRPNSSPG
jgi:hypothetical protein